VSGKLLKLCSRCKRPLADHTKQELRSCWPSLKKQ
jgi:hypothetical protein